MPRHLLQLWHHVTAEWHLERKWVLDHTASDQKRLGNVEPDDTVWAVTVYPEGELFLLGRLVVEECIDQKSAEVRFDYEVWEAKYHAIAKPGTVESLRKDNLTDIAQDLRFASKKNRLEVTDGRVNAQQLQTMRELTPESARMLEEKWSGPSLTNVEK